MNEFQKIIIAFVRPVFLGLMFTSGGLLAVWLFSALFKFRVCG